MGSAQSHNRIVQDQHNCTLEIRKALLISLETLVSENVSTVLRAPLLHRPCQDENELVQE